MNVYVQKDLNDSESCSPHKSKGARSEPSSREQGDSTMKDVLVFAFNAMYLLPYSSKVLCFKERKKEKKKKKNIMFF